MSELLIATYCDSVTVTSMAVDMNIWRPTTVELMTLIAASVLLLLMLQLPGAVCVTSSGSAASAAADLHSAGKTLNSS